jgi:hypothetical protein
MPFQVSPGVNVSEIDLTTIVPAVQTTGAGIAGHFRWGPTEQIVLVTDENSLVNNFQTPNANTADDFFTASNFLAYSNALQVVVLLSQATVVQILLLLVTLQQMLVTQSIPSSKMMTTMKKIILLVSQVLVTGLVSIRVNSVTH